MFAPWWQGHYRWCSKFHWLGSITAWGTYRWAGLPREFSIQLCCTSAEAIVRSSLMLVEGTEFSERRSTSRWEIVWTGLPDWRISLTILLRVSIYKDWRGRARFWFRRHIQWKEWIWVFRAYSHTSKKWLSFYLIWNCLSLRAWGR